MIYKRFRRLLIESGGFCFIPAKKKKTIESKHVYKKGIGVQTPPATHTHNIVSLKIKPNYTLIIIKYFYEPVTDVCQIFKKKIDKIAMMSLNKYILIQKSLC